MKEAVAPLKQPIGPPTRGLRTVSRMDTILAGKT
jgi:hypothetical protein